MVSVKLEVNGGALTRRDLARIAVGLPSLLLNPIVAILTIIDYVNGWLTTLPATVIVVGSVLQALAGLGVLRRKTWGYSLMAVLLSVTIVLSLSLQNLIAVIVGGIMFALLVYAKPTFPFRDNTNSDHSSAA